MKALIALLLIWFAALPLPAQGKKVITGKVTGTDGNPLPFVTVFLEGTADGTIADAKGEYALRTKLPGTVTVTASLLGYTTATRKLNLGEGSRFTADFTLTETVVTLKEAVVTASSFGSEKERGVVLSRIDVLMTPGGAADVFQSLKTLPGLTQVSESAELYVRGGEPNETTTIIDGAVLNHPFTFESSYGSLFSSVKTNFVKNLFFSSGGFSARYGNALSGVLDIETRGIPNGDAVNAGISMANATITADMALLNGAMGVSMGYDHSFTAPIFWLNGGRERFTDAPNSDNLTVQFGSKYSGTGSLKIVSIYSADRQGVNVERAEYSGTFTGSANSGFTLLRVKDVVMGNVALGASAAYSTYRNSWKLGILDLARTDNNITARVDLSKALSSYSALRAGAEYENRSVTYTGKIPVDENQFGEQRASKAIDATFRGRRAAGYIEYEQSRIAGVAGLGLTAGIRYDFIPGLQLGWVNPRANAAWKIAEASAVLFSWGLFNQLPDPRLFSPVDGNPNLKEMQAEHFIAAIDQGFTWGNIRLELYHKKYTNLPLQDAATRYNNNGYGRAYGADIIAKGDLSGTLSGWISYGYISATRYWMDFTRETSSGTDITHNITLVLKYNFIADWQAGINVKFATGRPFTPITGGSPVAGAAYYNPIEGETNSERFPDYRRFDLRLTHFATLFGNYRAVFFVEGLNILNLTNIFGYSYSADYTQRKEIKSYFGRRTVVVGMNLML